MSEPCDNCKAAARAHVTSLNKGATGHDESPNPLAKVVENLLSLVTKKMYGKPGHFLLELLQNADDAKYDQSVEPTYIITYSWLPNRIRLDCNEIGFDEDDVRGICGAGESTKENSPNTTGQKGIGFKSVFRVANVVYISSGPYTFKLDNNNTEMLGSLSPQWWDIPDHILTEKASLMHTTMILDIIKEEKIGQEVLNALGNFDANVMIFLRNLKTVEVNAYVTYRYTCIKTLEGDGTKHITIQRNGNPYLWYKTFEYLAKDLPPRATFPKIHRSMITIAFPVSKGFQDAILTYQQVYTYLPVNDFGLNFTIQADFDLTTPREDIEPGVSWNEALLAVIPEAFADAIEAICKVQAPLRYSWPIYISLSAKGFFANIGTHMKEQLRKRRILEVVAGPDQFESLDNVVFIPEKFRFHEAPLIMSTDTRFRYLSPKYPESSKVYLDSVGLKELKIDTFLDDLEAFINEDTLIHERPSTELTTEEPRTKEYEPFTRQSSEWHARIAEILHGECDKAKIKILKVIPLSDGTWSEIGSRADDIFFSSGDGNDDIAMMKGIRIRLVHPSIREDKESKRCRLFRTLGVRDYDIYKICELVTNAHSPGPPSLSGDHHLLPEYLLFHALLFYRYRQKHPSLPVDLWVATDTGETSLGSDTYFEKLELEGCTVPVLHKIYFNQFSGDESTAWKDWLESKLKIRCYPRLVESTGDEVMLSKEMSVILATWDTYKVLELLMAHWKDSYFKWLSKNSSENKSYLWKTSVEAVKECFTSLEVRCQDDIMSEDDVMCHLRETTLPSAELQDVYGASSLGLLMLPLADENICNWYFLENLGVTINPNVDTYLRCLEFLKRDCDDPSQIYLDKLLDRIYETCLDKEDRVYVKARFDEKKLVFIPTSISGQPPTWTSTKRCIWIGPELLRLKNLCAISGFYDQYENLFRGVLQVKPTVEIEDLLQEASAVTNTDQVDYIYELLSTIADFIVKFQDHGFPDSQLSEKDIRERLSQSNIFPIIGYKSGSFNKVDWSKNSSEWFIADRQSFFKNFLSEIPILAISADLLSKIDPLLRFLDCNWRVLSSLAKPIFVRRDLIQRSNDYAIKFRKVARYLESLIPRSNLAHTERVSMLLMEMEVYCSESENIEVKWLVRWLNIDCESHLDSRRGIATINNHGILQVYLTKKDMDSPITPLDLVADMMAVLGIPDDRGDVVGYILAHVATSDTAEIEAALQQNGYSLPMPIEENDVGGRAGQEIKVLGPDQESGLEEDTNLQRPSTSESKSEQEEPELELEMEQQQPENLESGTGLSSTSNKSTIVLDSTNQRFTLDSSLNDNVLSHESSGEELVESPLSTNNSADRPGIPQSIGYSASRAELLSKTLSKSSSEKEETPRNDFSDRGSYNGEDISTSFNALGATKRQIDLGGLNDTSFGDWADSENGESIDFEESATVSHTPLGASMSSSSSEKSQLHIHSKPRHTFPRKSDPPLPVGPSLKNLEHQIPRFPRAKAGQEHLEQQYKMFRRLKGTGLFRSTGSTSIIYVSNPSDLPEIGSNDSQSQTVLHSRMQIFKDENRSVFALIPTLINAEDIELAFLGQVWVSQLFSNRLFKYVPHIQWRSPVRNMLEGADVRPSLEDGDTTFVFEGKRDLLVRGELTDFLIQKKYKPAKKWLRHPPNYYIEVQTTSGPLSDPFNISFSTFDKIRNCGLSRVSPNESPKNVFVLIRLVNVRAKDSKDVPKAFIFVDPWNVYTEGVLHLTLDKLNTEGYTGTVDERGFRVSQIRPIEMTDPGLIENSKPARLFSKIQQGVRSALQGPSRTVNPPLIREFQWRSLGRSRKIRLLKLYPGNESSALEGHLKTYNLSSGDRSGDFPAYVAISYAWGSSLKQFALHTKDGTKEGAIMIPTSLFLGLRHLRWLSGSKAIYVWADAICIDQTQKPNFRNEEKEYQILLLSEIFKYASKVFAWLGEEEGDSQDAMAMINRLGKSILAGNNQPGPSTKSKIKAKQLIMDFGKEHPVWVAIARLVRRRWFQRIWIVQEVILASSLVVICGKERVLWDIFYQGLKFCLVDVVNHFRHTVTIAEPYAKKNIIDLGNMRSKFQTNEVTFRQNYDLFRVLEWCYQKETTEPRDRIFALLSLVNDADRKDFEPEYGTDELPLIQKFACNFVKRGYAIELLYRVRYLEPLHSVPSLPSWVPALTSNRYPKTMSTWSGNFRAALRTKEIAGIYDDKQRQNKPVSEKVSGGGVLILRGYQLDIIFSKGENPSLIDDSMSYLEEIFTSVKRIYDGKKSPEELEEIKWKTAIGDAAQLSNENRAYKNLDPKSAYGALVSYLSKQDRPQKATWKELERRFLSAQEGKTIISPDQVLWERLLPYWYTAMEFADMFEPAAVVCQTVKRIVGIIPAIANSGDIVVLFPGAKVPFLLRKREKRKPRNSEFQQTVEAEDEANIDYHLIGECYIHGIMQGEALPGPETELKEFRLV